VGMVNLAWQRPHQSGALYSGDGAYAGKRQHRNRRASRHLLPNAARHSCERRHCPEDSRRHIAVRRHGCQNRTAFRCRRAGVRSRARPDAGDLLSVLLRGKRARKVHCARAEDWVSPDLTNQFLRKRSKTRTSMGRTLRHYQPWRRVERWHGVRSFAARISGGAWTELDLHSFNGQDGAYPLAGLRLGPG
jgi:hypothetical protein